MVNALFASETEDWILSGGYFEPEEPEEPAPKPRKRKRPRPLDGQRAMFVKTSSGKYSPDESVARRIAALCRISRKSRDKDDPTHEEIWEQARAVREACPVPNDGGPRDGKHPAALHAEAAMRHAAQAIHEWSRRWNKPHDRFRSYTRLLERAILAHGWFRGEDPAGDTLLTYADACECLGINGDEMLSKIMDGVSPVSILWLVSLSAAIDPSTWREARQSPA